MSDLKFSGQALQREMKRVFLSTTHYCYCVIGYYTYSNLEIIVYWGETVESGVFIRDCVTKFCNRLILKIHHSKNLKSCVLEFVVFVPYRMFL